MKARKLKIEEIERKKAEIALQASDPANPVDAVSAEQQVIETIPPEEPELDDAVRRERIENETVALKGEWTKKVISEHVIYMKGVEVVYFEFKEIILALSNILRDKIDPTTGKMKVVLTKFIEEWLLRRLQSFVKFQIPTKATQSDATRRWPESVKDAEIRAGKEEVERVKRQEKKLQAEREQVQRELTQMAAEDVPAMD